MLPGSCVLLAGSLAILFFGSGVEAIQCYQCSECPDEGKLPDAQECKKITIAEAMFELTAKLAGVSTEVDIKESSKGEKETIELDECFKLVAAKDGVELVYRGCTGGSKNYDSCTTGSSGLTTCICHGDGCNAATTHVAHLALISCVSIVILLFSIS